jgi:cell division protein FtsB
MGKIKDIFSGPHRKFAWFVVVSTSVLILLWFIGPGNTFIHWGKAALEVKRQEKIIERLQKENEELDRRINMMKTDRDTLEKYAREEYNFTAPGEDVYLVE